MGEVNNGNKKIWILNHHACPPGAGSLQRHLYLAESLNKIGYKTTIINASFDHLNPHFIEGGDFGENLKKPLLRSYKGVDFYSIPTPFYEGSASIGRIKNMLAYYFRAMKYLRGINDTSRPDLVVGTTVHPFAAYAGYRLSKHYKVPFVYEVRDLWPRTLVELGKISPRHPFVILLDKLDGFLAKKAKLIITTAPLMKDHYKERFAINTDKFLWITNGTNFINNTLTPMRKIGIGETINVGYTGTIGFANGIREFLEALDNVPKETLNRFNFTFVGEGPLKKEMSVYAGGKGLPVEFKDMVNKEDLWNMLIKFDMLLLVTLSTKLYRFGISPNKLADYHAVGRPIIMITKASENPVLISGSGYLKENMKDLASLLQEILSDSAENYELMALRGREYALEEYDWNKLALKLKNRLDSVLL
jgi:glycosyltransferase involved in cell wall biosynthesis